MPASSCRRSCDRESVASRTCADTRLAYAVRSSSRARRISSSARLVRASASAEAALTSSPRRPVMGSDCVTVHMFSVTPATASRLYVARGFGQRPAASTSARARSAAARMARTRGLSEDSRARASASEGLARGRHADREQRDGHATRACPHSTPLVDREISDDGRSGRVSRWGKKAREGVAASSGGSWP